MVLGVTVYAEDDGSYWAQVPELPGLFASGFSMDELWEALTEAIGMYLSQPDRPRDAATKAGETAVGECARKGTVEHTLSIHTPFLIREVRATCSCGWESGWTANERYARAAWERHCQEDLSHDHR